MHFPSQVIEGLIKVVKRKCVSKSRKPPMLRLVTDFVENLLVNKEEPLTLFPS